MGGGGNGVTVTGLHKVTAIFSNCNVTGLHFQSKECNGTWGYFMGEKFRYSKISTCGIMESLYETYLGKLNPYFEFPLLVLDNLTI